MAKKKLAKVQDIPGMKIYDGPDGPEMYTTDPRFHQGCDWLELFMDAKRECRKVKITFQESPEAEPQVVVIAPYKLESSVEGWTVHDLPPEGFKGPKYSMQSIIAAELTDETFEDPYKDPEYFIAEMMAERKEWEEKHKG